MNNGRATGANQAEQSAAAAGGERASGASLVPSFVFTADGLEADENVAAWRDAVATLFDVDEFVADEAGRFRADLYSYAMGPILLGLARSGGQRFRRTPQTIARSGVDHIVLQFYARGGYDGRAGDLPIRVRAGDICVLDLAQTLETRATAFENLTIVVPRPMFDAHLIKVEELHGLVLPREGALAPLVARHLTALFEAAPRLTVHECHSVIGGTVSFIGACLRGEVERRDADRGHAADGSLARIRQYIEANLGDPELSAGSIAARFGLSRASLYRLFMPIGGIADHIRSRRLHRAFFDLAMNSRNLRISEVARRWQLGSDAHFTRLFKAAYGVTPSAARDAALLGTGLPGSSDRADGSSSPITRWMRDIAPPQGGD